jgi:ribosome-binding protein aMBF1 (putative translation factor)
MENKQALQVSDIELSSEIELDCEVVTDIESVDIAPAGNCCCCCCWPGYV